MQALEKELKRLEDNLGNEKEFSDVSINMDMFEPRKPPTLE